jgi:hypothetical protein
MISIEKRALHFLERANKKFNYKYTYDIASYICAKTPIEISCPIHGSDKIRPDTHIQSETGCSDCQSALTLQRRQKITLISFLSDCKKKHGDKYGYDKINFITRRDKITVKCPVHEYVEINGYAHIDGRGCPKCVDLIPAVDKEVRGAAFIRNSKDKFHLKFDYTEVRYVNQSTPIILTCIDHQERYEIAPIKHLYSKYGSCKVCRAELRSYKSILNRKPHNKDNKTSFINKAKTVHGDIYNYDNVHYVNSSTKVEVICDKHGPFHQVPNSHLRGSGCPVCAKEKSAQKQLPTHQTYVNKVEKAFPGKFTFELTKYRGTKKDVTITCKNHGPFTRTAELHYQHDCPRCHNELRSQNRLTPIETIRDKVESRGGILLSKKYEKGVKVKVQCANGHHFSAVWPSINSGSWCRYCDRYFGERFTRHVLELMLGGTFKKSFPNFLINPKTKRRLQLDGYDETLKIAFEYQGEQHFDTSHYYYTEGGMYRDQLKREQCRRHDVVLIEVREFKKNYGIKENIEHILKSIPQTLNPKLVSVKDIEDSGFTDFKLKELEDIALENGQQMVTRVYFGVNNSYELKCPVPDHSTYFVPGTNFNRQHWCPACEDKDLQSRLDIARGIIRDRNGEFVKFDASGKRLMIHYRCENEHLVKIRFDHLRNKVKCNKCHSDKRKEEAYKRLIENAKFKNCTILQEKYLGKSKAHRFMCNVCGTIDEKSPQLFKQTKGCRPCARKISIKNLKRLVST